MRLIQDVIDDITFMTNADREAYLKKRFPDSIITVKTLPNGDVVIEVGDERTTIKVY